MHLEYTLFWNLYVQPCLTLYASVLAIYGSYMASWLLLFFLCIEGHGKREVRKATPSGGSVLISTVFAHSLFHVSSTIAMHNLTLTKLACGHGLDIQPLIQNLVDPSEQAYKQATKQPKMCMQLISTCMQWIFQSCIFLEAHFNRHTFNLQQTVVGSLPRSCVLLLQFPLGSTRRCQLWCWKTSRRWVSVQKQWVWWLLHSLLLMAVQGIQYKWVFVAQWSTKAWL